MKYQVNLLALLFSIVLFPSCHHEDIVPETTEVTEVKYGTSFGKCAGYCINDLKLADGTRDSYHHYFGGQQDRSCSESYDNWESLKSSINFDVFKQLDEVIGCPDCADGGAEWIEITAGVETYKVIFEFHIEPSTTDAYIEELRDQLEAMIGICL